MLRRIILGVAAAVLGLSAVTPLQAAPGASSARVLYKASWTQHLSGWPQAGGAWTYTGGILSYNGGNASVIVAPFKLNRSHYAIEATMRLLQWRQTGISESHGFGILLRAKGAVDPTASTAGLMAGIGRGFIGCDGAFSQAVVATADTDFTSVSRHSSQVRAGSSWHVFRAEVNGNAIKVLLDGKSVAGATTSKYAGQTSVGIFSLSARIQVKSFKVYGL